MPFWKKATLLVLATVAVFFWSAILQTPQKEELAVYFFDVGQGDSAFIETPSGTQMLIDGGPSNIVLERLGKVMPYHDKSIDVVVMTHPQADHIAGLVPVFENYDIGMVVESGVGSNSPFYQELEHLIEEKQIRRVFARAGTRIAFDNETVFDIFSPYEDVHAGEIHTGNDIMVVGKLRYKNSSLLLTGDLEKIDELNLALSNLNLKSGVLKVAHHGSRYSSSLGFLERVLPHLAVISVGINTYGHPHEETVARLQDIQASILRTDNIGTIKLTSNGTHFEIVN